MVNVQPFVFQHVTAFKERLQLANKINEMIAVLNNTMDPEEVLTIVRAELVNYYTKEEVDDLIAGIDLSPYYTKTEVDGIIDGVQDSIDVIADDVDALEENKQNVLTPVAPISIDDNSISLNDFTEVTDTDWSSYGSAVFDAEGHGRWTVTIPKDILLVSAYNGVSNYNPVLAQTLIRKGTWSIEYGVANRPPYVAVNFANGSVPYNIEYVGVGYITVTDLFGQPSTRASVKVYNKELVTFSTSASEVDISSGFRVQGSKITVTNSATENINPHLRLYVRE